MKRVCCNTYLLHPPPEVRQFLISLCISVLYIVLGGILYSVVEEVETVNGAKFGTDWTKGISVCFSTVFTIGWRLLTPLTWYSKVYVVLYAFFGIPLVLTSLYQFQLCIRYCLWRLYCKFVFCDGLRCPEDNEGVREWQPPFSLLYTVTVLYFVAGSVIVSFLEEMDVLSSFYLVFISASTIGYMEPLFQNALTMVGFYLYVAVALALLSLVFEHMQQNILYIFNKYG